MRLWPPCHPHCGGRTVWTDEGKRFYELHRHTEPPVPLEPGEHYVVVAQGAPGDPYFVYPDEQLLHRFRHEWVLKRHKCPMVPSPAATPLPNFKRSKEENSRIFSAYLRPWVLSRQQASFLVPHLADLDLVSRPTTAEIRTRCTKKRRVGPLPVRSFRTRWKSYVRGGIVSEHARRIVVNFVSACCAGARRDSDSEEEVKEDNVTPLPVPGMQLPLTSVHRLIQQHAQQHEKGTDDDATRRSSAVAKALALGSTLWGVARDDADSTTLLDNSGCMHVPMPSTKAAAKRTFPTVRRALPVSATSYNKYRKPTAERWLRELADVGRLCSRRMITMKPNPEQIQVLKDIIDRCGVEAMLERRSQP